MTALRNIALVANAQVRFLMLDVARELQERHGSKVHLYCSTPQEVDFYQQQNSDNVLSSVNLAPGLPNLALEPVEDPAREIEIARKREKEIGRTYASLSVANRHLGRGYALGGFYYPRSRQAIHSTHENVIHAYNRHFDYWEKQVQEKCLTLFLGGPAEVSWVAIRHDIPFRRLAGSRYRNFHFWTHNEFNESKELVSAYEELDKRSFSQATLDAPYKLVGTINQQFDNAMSVFGLIRQCSIFLLLWTYYRIRGYEKAHGYLVRDELRLIYRHWRAGRRFSKNFARLSDLDGQQFVFFPLATEPETSLQQFSPEFFFQHAAIAALSRDLPAGVKLVVKETNVGAGRRPADFYEQVAELKNVVWMDIREPGFAVAKKASAVAIITGSTGFEAAVVGTPVISFGAHNMYNMLPHVFHLTDLARTGEIVRKIFDGGIDTEGCKQAGARYLQAVIDSSFDLGDYDYVNLRNYSQRVIDDACNALERSLGIGEISASRMAKAG